MTLHNCKIFLADDEPSILELLENLLRKDFERIQAVKENAGAAIIAAFVLFADRAFKIVKRQKNQLGMIISA